MILKKLIIASGLLMILVASPVIAATENDLREVAGMERIDAAEANSQAAAIIASCSQDMEWNELIDMLPEYGINNTTALNEEIAETGAKAYKTMMQDFKSGKPASRILESYNEYDTYYITYEKIYEPKSVELEKIDEEDIATRLEYAQSLIDIAGNLKNIGKGISL